MIPVNMDRAKEIAHQVRRQRRNLEFYPHDQMIAKQIPGPESANAEAERVKIREKYAQVQNEINATQSWDELKVVVEEHKL